MTEQDDILCYLVSHYWDSLLDTTAIGNYREDTTYLAGVSLSDVEQAFANYIGFTAAVPWNVAVTSIESLYSHLIDYKSSSNESFVFEKMSEIIERYLYDPNSPLRNEDLYHYFAGCMSESDLVDEVSQDRYRDQYLRTGLNMVGSKASDFFYIDSNGHPGSLHAINSEYTLLFFVNPGCMACKEIIDILAADKNIIDLQTAGRLKVIDVYIDEEIQDWMSNKDVYPPYWITAYEHNHIIRDELLYDVRAIPSLYLLDRDKRVIFKDAPVEQIFDYLLNL